MFDGHSDSSANFATTAYISHPFPDTEPSDIIQLIVVLSQCWRRGAAAAVRCALCAARRAPLRCTATGVRAADADATTAAARASTQEEDVCMTSWFVFD
jgi:hypothetical protein